MVHDLMSPPPKPTILFVPGAACPSQPFYQPLCTLLTTSHGYQSETYDLPSASRSPPQEPGTLEDDVDVFRSKLDILVGEEGKDVVLLAHSYGGMVATDAARGFARAERQAKGLKGGVVRIVYLSCIIAGVGENAGEVCVQAGLDFKMEGVGENNEYLTQIGPESAQMVFSDLPPEEALHWQSRQSLQSAICYQGKCVYDAYRHIPVTFILCTEDQILTYEFQLGRVEMLKKAGGEIDVLSMRTGHCPNISDVEQTARVIVQAIEKAGGKAEV